MIYNQVLRSELQTTFRHIFFFFPLVLETHTRHQPAKKRKKEKKKEQRGGRPSRIHAAQVVKNCSIKTLLAASETVGEASPTTTKECLRLTINPQQHKSKQPCKHRLQTVWLHCIVSPTRESRRGLPSLTKCNCIGAPQLTWVERSVEKPLYISNAFRALGSRAGSVICDGALSVSLMPRGTDRHVGGQDESRIISGAWVTRTRSAIPVILYYSRLLSLQSKIKTCLHWHAERTSFDIHHATKTVNIGYSSAFAILAVFTFLSPEGFQEGSGG